MGLWAPGDRLPGGSSPTLSSRCLPWPPPRRRRASGPAGSFPSGRLHSCWCGVSKSPVSTLRKPDTEAETTGGGGKKGPMREGRRFGQVAGSLRSALPQEGLGTLSSGTGTGARGARGSPGGRAGYTESRCGRRRGGPGWELRRAGRGGRQAPRGRRSPVGSRAAAAGSGPPSPSSCTPRS